MLVGDLRIVARRLARAINIDEFLHHRGQLYTYVRACGAEPPFMWGFEDNAEGFQPRG